MARVSSFTVFLWVTLVAFTIFSATTYAAVTESTFRNPYGSTVEEWEFGAIYEFSQAKNITKLTKTDFNALNPIIRIEWAYSFTEGGFFRVYRTGVEWWDGWYYYEMAGSPLLESRVLADWSPDKNFSKYIFDLGGPFEAHLFFYPAWADETGETFVYPTLAQSMAANLITVVVGTNATYPNYGVHLLFGAATGFSDYGTPLELSIIIAAIWWVLFLLALVKLVVG